MAGKTNGRSNNSISCVVVEDDEVSQLIIGSMIGKTPFLTLVKSFTDPIEASHYLRENRVELIFLDIEMPNLNGFELLSLLDYKPTVIVMTSENKYAAEAFNYEVHDFLVKPVKDYPRFLRPLLKLQEMRVKPPTDAPSNVFVKADSLLHNIIVEQILYIEAFGDYVKIHTDKKVLMVLATLKSFETKVPGSHFARVHRSFIVNLRRIDNIDPNNLQIGTAIIPISPNHREELLSKIELI